MGRQKHQKGFTLIELIVIVSIIGFVTAGALYMINSVRDNAEATRIAANFQLIEKALILWKDDQGVNQWWRDNNWQAACSAGPSLPSFGPNINCLITNYELKKFLKSAPNLGSAYPRYDNNNWTSDCSLLNWNKGVNICYLTQNAGVKPSIFKKINKIVDNDNDNFNCGKIVGASEGRVWLCYKISNSYNN